MAAKSCVCPAATKGPCSGGDPGKSTSFVCAQGHEMLACPGHFAAVVRFCFETLSGGRSTNSHTSTPKSLYGRMLPGKPGHLSVVKHLPLKCTHPKCGAAVHTSTGCLPYHKMIEIAIPKPEVIDDQYQPFVPVMSGEVTEVERPTRPKTRRELENEAQARADLEEMLARKREKDAKEAAEAERRADEAERLVEKEKREKKEKSETKVKIKKPSRRDQPVPWPCQPYTPPSESDSGDEYATMPALALDTGYAAAAKKASDSTIAPALTAPAPTTPAPTAPALTQATRPKYATQSQHASQPQHAAQPERTTQQYVRVKLATPSETEDVNVSAVLSTMQPWQPLPPELLSLPSTSSLSFLSTLLSQPQAKLPFFTQSEADAKKALLEEIASLEVTAAATRALVNRILAEKDALQAEFYARCEKKQAELERMLADVGRRERLVAMREDTVAAREWAVSDRREEEDRAMMNVAVDIPEWLRNN